MEIRAIAKLFNVFLEQTVLCLLNPPRLANEMRDKITVVLACKNKLLFQTDVSRQRVQMDLCIATDMEAGPLTLRKKPKYVIGSKLIHIFILNRLFSGCGFSLTNQVTSEFC